MRTAGSHNNSNISLLCVQQLKIDEIRIQYEMTGMSVTPRI
jgi:hypothetical protein